MADWLAGAGDAGDGLFHTVKVRTVALVAGLQGALRKIRPHALADPSAAVLQVKVGPAVGRKHKNSVCQHLISSIDAGASRGDRDSCEVWPAKDAYVAECPEASRLPGYATDSCSRFSEFVRGLQEFRRKAAGIDCGAGRFQCWLPFTLNCQHQLRKILARSRGDPACVLPKSHIDSAIFTVDYAGHGFCNLVWHDVLTRRSARDVRLGKHCNLVGAHDLELREVGFGVFALRHGSVGHSCCR
mmetsp:Transcript_35404/g.63903  ORF Transcript_35404/g.63903 Transcript_35404/m.63903 type:complete len:243 (-) Transcript_35404:439-1167(-)